MIPDKHKPIRSKTKKSEALLAHPFISRHVPQTVWFDQLNLNNMLDRYSTIYIKPDTGRQGQKVIRIKRIKEALCEISSSKVNIIVPLSRLSAELETLMSGKKYIIQQGVDLATYKNCPFDIRMVMQKPYTTWELTLTSARVAPAEDAVVTNISMGAKDFPLHEILHKNDQKIDSLAMIKKLVDLAHQVCSILGTKFSLRIIGLDMAVDKKGKVWFIEANTKPQCKQCKLVNDQLTQEKFTEFKAIISGQA